MITTGNQKGLNMAKRFTDTTKWQDDWFLNLSAEDRLFWFYLCDNCDHAGIWRISQKAAELMLGYSIDLDKFLQVAGDRLKKIDGDYWHLTKFCAFQYGVLNLSNSAHRGALKILEARGLEAPYTQPKPSPKPHKDKDTDKVKVTDTEFNDWYSVYPRKQKREDAFKAWCDLAPDAELQATMKAVIPAQIKGHEWWKEEKKQFIPLPASWIRAKRWTDQFQQVRDTPKRKPQSMDDL